MSSDFHLSTELPPNGDPHGAKEEDPEERRNRMAAAIETGLRYCATDPLVRLKMILGETYAEYMLVVDKLRDKLAAENEAVRALAETMACDVSILELSVTSSRIASTQQDLLAAALDPDPSG